MAQEPLSPLTGVIREEDVIIDFGEHEGKSVLEVAETLPMYYTYLIEKRDSENFSIRRSKDKLFRLYLKEFSG